MIIDIYDLIKYLLIFTILLIIIAVLSLKKIKLFCIGCSNGSWWYNCADGTGNGSVSCDIYKTTYNNISSIFNNIYLLKSYIDDILNSFTKAYTDTTNIILTTGNVIKEALVLKKLGLPDIPLPNISCDSGLIGDICSPINSVIRDIISSLNKSGSYITSLLDNINILFEKILGLLSSILDKFIILFESLLKDIMNPITDSYLLIINLKNEITSIFNSISDLGIINIIIVNITSILQVIIPFQLIHTIGVAFLVLFLIIVLPIIGVLYMILKLIFSIIYMIFSFIIGTLFGSILSPILHIF